MNKAKQTTTSTTSTTTTATEPIRNSAATKVLGINEATKNSTRINPFSVKTTKPTLNTLKNAFKATMNDLSKPFMPQPMMVTPSGQKVPVYTPGLTKSTRNTQRSNMTIKRNAAPDGGDLVVADNAITTKNRATGDIKKNIDGALRKQREAAPLETGGASVPDTNISRKTIQKIKSKNLETGALVSPHLGEILKTARSYTGKLASDDGRHSIARDGWMYPTSYIQDKHGGPIMEVKSNIGVNKDRGNTLYDVQLTTDIQGKKNTPQQPYAKRGATSVGGVSYNIAQNTKSVNTLKQRQNELIQKTNPMRDEIHVGIRNASDIKTYDEIMARSESAHEAEGEFSYPDWTKKDAEAMMKNGGKVTCIV